jgi:hypothetical protein
LPLGSSPGPPPGGGLKVTAGLIAASNGTTVALSSVSATWSTAACAVASSVAVRSGTTPVPTLRIICSSVRLPGPASRRAEASAALDATTVATAMPSARLIAASAAPERAWLRPRSRRASRGASGNRRATGGSTRTAVGLSSSIPTAVASVPPMTSAGSASSRRVSMPAARAANPPASRASPRANDRRAGRGRGGRADRAWTIGTRATARDGHHAATVAVTTASAMPPTVSHHGWPRESMRRPNASSRCPAAAIHAPSPIAPPTVAATIPTAAPLATITSRRCFSVAPIAASMPSWRIRRWATTTNPAAAISETSSSTTVVIDRSSTAPVVSPSSPRSRSPMPPGVARLNASSCSREPSTRSDSDSDRSSSEIGASANSSPRSAGFSTRPTTVRSRPPTSTVSPVATPRSDATRSVTAISSAPSG